MVYYDKLEFNSEIEFELYILNKYLTKHYDSDTSIKLIESNKNDIDKLAKALGAKDIAFFCLYFLSDIFVVKDSNEARELSKDHYHLWDIANSVFIQDEYDKVNILCPRGFAKSTIFNLAAAIWLHCYKQSLFTIIGAKTDSDAVQFLDSVKKVFNENKKIINNFGTLIDAKKYKTNANEVELTNGTYIRTVGSGTSVRGSNWGGIRPTTFIGDDFQDEKNILTDDAREKQYNKWTKEIEQCGDKAVYRKGKKIKKATKIIAIGTVLHKDCLASRLSRNNDYYTVLKRAVLLEANQTIDDIFESELWIQCKKIYFDDKLENTKDHAKAFYEDHKEEMQFPVLWPEKWDCFNDLAIPYWENRQAFMSELMNDASSIGEKWFKSVRTQTTEEIENHKFIKTMLCADPASTTNKKSDYTAIGVGSKADNDFTYLRDLIMKKISFNEYCKSVVDLLVKWEDITHINIEKNTYNGADVLKIKELIEKDSRLKNRKFEWINEMQRKNKDEKISTIVDPINNGQIIINSECEDSSEAIEQLKDFQGQQYTLHDDFADMLSEIENRLKEINKSSKVTFIDRRMLGL